MKKSNKKGFILAETIAVSVVIMTALVIIYTQFMTISKSYARTFTYNSVNNMYLVNNVKEYIKDDGFDKLIEELDNKLYIDITSCPTSYFINYIYCRSLVENSNIKQIIFTKQNLEELENNLDDGLSEKMKQFIKSINYDEANNHRLIVEFNDETYATLVVSNIKEEEFAMDPVEFDYTGGEQVFTVPHSGYYQLEAWGAQGGGSTGGKGAYTSGMIYLNEGEKIYVYVGSQGGSNSTITNIGGYNGGGYSGNNVDGHSYGGGGATDFRLNNGVWNDSTSLASRIMVAAGGAGGVSVVTTTGGEGGTLIGGNSTTSISDFSSSNYNATGGTQIGAGLSFESIRGGSFGQGKQSNTDGWGGGGGSGYYGGSTGFGRTGSGGSSYVSGYVGCIAIKSATDITPKVTTYSKIEDSYHYSDKIFENPIMIAGTASMPTHDGQGTMTGNSGNGYAKITYIGESL